MIWIAGVSRDSHLFEVYLNGVREAQAVRCDTERGWLERRRVGTDGEFVIDALTRKPIEDRIHGHVELRPCNLPTWR